MFEIDGKPHICFMVKVYKSADVNGEITSTSYTCDLHGKHEYSTWVGHDGSLHIDYIACGERIHPYDPPYVIASTVYAAGTWHSYLTETGVVITNE